MWLALIRVERNAAPGGRAATGTPMTGAKGPRVGHHGAETHQDRGGVWGPRPQDRAVEVPGDRKTCRDRSDAAARGSAAPARDGYLERCDVGEV